MKTLGFCLSLALFAASAAAQARLPVLDVHVHAYPADQQGPPPLAMCTPIPEFPAWDPASGPYGAAFMAMLKNPPCEDPVWSPETDEELMRQTLEVMDRLNVFGVLSGTPERVATWMDAAPGRFLPGLELTAARFLSEEQKRDILYDNAARFLRLSEEEIARHYGR